MHASVYPTDVETSQYILYGVRQLFNQAPIVKVRIGLQEGLLGMAGNAVS
jgi:hypothetical protein